MVMLHEHYFGLSSLDASSTNSSMCIFTCMTGKGHFSIHYGGGVACYQDMAITCIVSLMADKP